MGVFNFVKYLFWNCFYIYYVVSIGWFCIYKCFVFGNFSNGIVNCGNWFGYCMLIGKVVVCCLWFVFEDVVGKIVLS